MARPEAQGGVEAHAGSSALDPHRATRHGRRAAGDASLAARPAGRLRAQGGARRERDRPGSGRRQSRLASDRASGRAPVRHAGAGGGVRDRTVRRFCPLVRAGHRALRRPVDGGPERARPVGRSPHAHRRARLSGARRLRHRARSRRGTTRARSGRPLHLLAESRRRRGIGTRARRRSHHRGSRPRRHRGGGSEPRPRAGVRGVVARAPERTRRRLQPRDAQTARCL